MGIRFMEHILILTHDPEGTRDWWVNALGFRHGENPEFGFPVYWLFLGDQDIIHIGPAEGSAHQRKYLVKQNAPGQGSGCIDHVCFNCEGLGEFVERLEANGVEFHERQAFEGARLHQMFLRDPINDIKVELNFPAEEARALNRKPGYMGTDIQETAARDEAPA